jgi:DNA processing protein
MDAVEILALKLIPGIGNRSLINIVDSGLTTTEIISRSDLELKTIIKGNQAFTAIQELKTRFEMYFEEARNLRSTISTNGVEIISYSDTKYPKYLRMIKDWPPIVFAKGNLQLLEEPLSIAIVGSRECTDIGRKISTMVSKEFASAGTVIVSGLARGIDAAAHEGALEVHGSTIAVLVDVENIYPKEHVHLAERILSGNGLLISENLPGVRMVKGLLSTRDRLQSGMSLAVIPIETKVNGGTMHTARYAIEQNRHLYCPNYANVQGYPLDIEQYQGVGQLINSGQAKAITSQDYKNILEKDLPTKRKELISDFSENETQQAIFK